MGLVSLPIDPTTETVIDTLSTIGVEVDPIDTMVKTGQNIIYITNRRKHVLIDLIRDF